MDYDYTKLLQLFIKPRHFHKKKKKNEMNIIKKSFSSKILAACLQFLFIFKVFSSFLQFNSQNLEAYFVSCQKKPLFLSVLLKKIELLRFVSRETSDVLLSNIPHLFCFTWNNGRIQTLHKNNVSRETKIMETSVSFRFI